MSSAGAPVDPRCLSRASAGFEDVDLDWSVTPSSYFRWKAYLSRGFAFLLLLPALPVIALLIALIRVTSRGPAIYSQQRVGKKGKVFTMYKLRSMYTDAESASGAVWTQDGDPRVTPFGSFLRKSHLDELPQLYNVLRGDMDLFGPRPERPEFVEVLAAAIPGYRERLLVLPGISGLAQINLPPDSDLESVKNKLALDVEYIRTASLWLDARMFTATLIRLLGVPGEVTIKLTGLKREGAQTESQTWTSVGLPRATDLRPELVRKGVRS